MITLLNYNVKLGIVFLKDPVYNSRVRKTELSPRPFLVHVPLFSDPRCKKITITIILGHALYMDNYYNSVTLTHYLTARSTYCCGTLNKKRRLNPKEEVLEPKIKKGEMIFRRSGDTTVCKWKVIIWLWYFKCIHTELRFCC